MSVKVRAIIGDVAFNGLTPKSKAMEERMVPSVPAARSARLWGIHRERPVWKNDSYLAAAVQPFTLRHRWWTATANEHP